MMKLFKEIIDAFKITMDFIWRHAFVFASIALLIHFVLDGWTLNIIGIVKLFLIAAAMDWVKRKIKFDPSYTPHPSFEMTQPLHVRDYRNNNMIGTPTNLSNLGHNRYN